MRNGGGHGTLKSPGPALKSGPELNGEISVAEQMVNSEKPERGCKRWTAVFDRDGNEEQCRCATIRPAVVWGLLDGPA